MPPGKYYQATAQVIFFDGFSKTARVAERLCIGLQPSPFFLKKRNVYGLSQRKTVFFLG